MQGGTDAFSSSANAEALLIHQPSEIYQPSNHVLMLQYNLK